jgi:hypothetical protein
MSIKILTLDQFWKRFEANEANEGEVRMVSGCAGTNRSNNNPLELNTRTSRLRQGMCICHKHYKRYVWTSLDKLSKTNKLKFANTIEVAFRNHCISQNLDVDLGAGTYYDMQKECEILEIAVRKKNLEMETFRLSTETILKKKTCPMEGCPGMCAIDFDRYNKEGFEECFCCKKKQELDCPICYDTLSVNNMVKGDNCAHYICWKCYGQAYKGGNPIKCCPMCRSQFAGKERY